MVDGTSRDIIGGTPADDGSYDFFVSYFSGDEEWASWIAWQLEKGLHQEDPPPRVFVRGWHVVAGMHEAISRNFALSASARLIAVLTPEYLTSDDYSYAEWATFWAGDPAGRQRRVVPVRVKDCQPKGFLEPIFFIDLVGQDAAEATVTLLSGITASVEGRAKPLTAPPFPGSDQHTEPPEAVPPFPGPPVVVGEPPAVPPKWFQDRTPDIEEIERHLGDDRTGLVMVVGEAGLGKTAMIHRLWERILEGTSPLRVHGLVYQSAHGFGPVTADSVVNGLIEVFPKHEAEQLKVTIRQHKSRLERLVILLTALAGRQVILAIDAIEELLNDDKDIADPALRELVEYLAPRADRGVRLLLVGRQTARAVQERFPDVTYRHNLDGGLPEPDAFALLEVMDADRTLNLDAVSEHDKARLHRLTGGSPRTLELTYGVLASGDFTFTRLLDFMAQAGDKRMVVHLLEHACERLPAQERRVLQVLAVYGRPVRATAVEHLISTAVPGLEIRPVLGRLSGLRLAQSDGVYFSVLADVERGYLIDELRREAKRGACETPEALMRQAAAYFHSRRHDDPRGLGDLRSHLMEIELTLRAGDHEKALELMGDVDDDYLHSWGSSSALVSSLKTLLSADGIPRTLRIDAKSLLARALIQQEDHKDAAKQLEEALRLVSGDGRTHRRIVLRKQLTATYIHLSRPRQAAQHCRKVFRAGIWRRRYRTDAIATLADLALCQAKAGRLRPSLQWFRRVRRALERSDTTMDRVDQLPMLLNEAWVLGQLGERDRARSLLRECRRRADALDERGWKGRCILSEAQLALDDGDLQGAVTLAEDAYAIGVHNGNRWLCGVAMEVLAIARLEQDDLRDAARAADIVQRNRRSVLGFGLVGLAAYRLGHDVRARVAFNTGFMEASEWHQANEPDFQLLDAYGLVACGLALLGEPSCLATAVTVFKEVRNLTPAPGAVHRTLTLLKQFEPRADPAILEQVRTAAKG